MEARNFLLVAVAMSVALLSSCAGKQAMTEHSASEQPAEQSAAEQSAEQARAVETFTDPRDSQTYRVITVGSQTWMAQNLNYQTKTADSWCYDNDDSNCATHGRLYTWDAAMTACPAGWRLPSNDDWDSLMVAADGDYFENDAMLLWMDAGVKLRSRTGWHAREDKDPDTPPLILGTDDFGFSALPGGVYFENEFTLLGHIGTWWSTEKYDTVDVQEYFARARQMGYFADAVIIVWANINSALSVRCVMGEAAVIEEEASATIEEGEEVVEKAAVAPDVPYESFVDTRDNQTYRAVQNKKNICYINLP